MITINFYPESDREKYVNAAKEYTEIWNKSGEKIFKAIEKLSGLKFKTRLINAVTYKGHSNAFPLRLRSEYSLINKEAVLIHELCHRLLADNYFYFFDTTNLSEDIHKTIDLILYDIWVLILGKNNANERVDKEISYGDVNYKNAWKWALSFDIETRRKKFKELTTKYSNHPKAKKKT